MNDIYNFIVSNIYLYIFILIALVIIISILIIVILNQKNRNKIKNDFVEAEKIEEELQKVESNETTNELEEILKKMQADAEVKPEDVVKKFEEEQEEKAIISYKELVDNVKSGKIEVVDDEDTGVNYLESFNIESEPILEASEDSGVTPQMVKDAIVNISTSSVKEEPKKFQNSKIISPIFGIMQDNLEYPTIKKTENVLDIMNTKEYNELTEEIKQQEEFLEALKRFRSNL